MSESSNTPPATSTADVTPANTNTATPVAEAGNQVAEHASPQVEEAAPKQPTEIEIKEAIKKWKLKSQGKTREVTDEAELVRLAQLGLGAHEKFEQAAKTRKQAEAIVELLQKDPGKALSSLGMDVRKLAEDYLITEAKKLQMTPEERQKSEIQEEIERLKLEREDLQKQQREERISQLQTKYEADIQNQIIDAIDKYKLPKNPKTVSRIAEYMASALENGYEATALDVATRVRQDLEEEHKSLFSHYDVEDLIKLLGDDQLKKIRQHDVQKVKAKAPAQPTKTEPVATPNREREEKSKKSYTMDEFLDEVNKYTK